MKIDLKKEIKLSDLFRRKGKDRGEAMPQEKKPKAKRFAFSLGRSKDRDAPPKEKKTRTRRSFRGSKAPKAAAPSFVAKSAPALPEIPLMRAFNLLPREDARAKKARVGLAQVLVALFGLLVFAGLAAFFLLSSAKVGDRQSTYDDLRVELAALEVPEEGPLAGKGSALAGEKSTRTSTLATALGDRLAWDRVLRELALVIPDDVSLLTFSATLPTPPADPAAAAAAPTQSLTITGLTEDHESVALFLSRLSIIPELTSVALVSSNEAVETGDINFTISAGIRREGATA